MSSPDLVKKYRQRLTQPGQKEGIRQTLYHFQTYGQAGLTMLKFFQIPVGNSGATFADTNMTLAGQIPQGWKFNIESIELHIFPGSTANNYTVQTPVRTATAVYAPSFANDVWALAQSGFMTVTIGSKPYLNEGPLMKFPPKCGMLVNGSAAIEGTAALQEVTMDYARMAGRPYVLEPNLPIPPNMNFDVTLNWPTAVALPSGFAARVGVVLDGILFRD